MKRPVTGALACAASDPRRSVGRVVSLPPSDHGAHQIFPLQKRHRQNTRHVNDHKEQNQVG
jgi:hypothetical protein